MEKDNTISVVCGIIIKNDTVFIARRKKGKSLEGYWEFPGGKIEAEESPQNALKRELKEELGMQVRVEEFLTETTHCYTDFTINLQAYRCQFKSATFVLTDHDRYQWMALEKLKTINLAPADRPIVEYILQKQL